MKRDGFARATLFLALSPPACQQNPRLRTKEGTMTTIQPTRLSVVLTHLWQRTSARGERDLSGWLGNLTVLAMPNRDRQNDGDAIHVLPLADRSSKREAN